MIKSKLNSKCGIRLKTCLEEYPMSQNELSSLTGYTQQYISNIVVGKKPMTAKAAKLFSEQLGVRQEYLLCEDNLKASKDKWNANDKLWDLSDSLITNYIQLLGVKIEYKFCEIESEDFKEMNEVVDIEGTFSVPEKWTITLKNGAKLETCLKSLLITYQDITVELSIGKYISFIDSLQDYILFMIQQLPVILEREEHANARDLSISAHSKESQTNMLKNLKSAFPDDIMYASLTDLNK